SASLSIFWTALGKKSANGRSGSQAWQGLVLARAAVIEKDFRVMKKVKRPGMEKATKSLHRVHSSLVIDGPDRAASRAMLHAVGFNVEDFGKSQIGIASTWSMVTPCNMHID